MSVFPSLDPSLRKGGRLTVRGTFFVIDIGIKESSKNVALSLKNFVRGKSNIGVCPFIYYGHSVDKSS